MKLEEYNKVLVKVCFEKKLFLKKIGKVKNYPIFAIRNSNKNNLKTLVFCAGIHGDEVAPGLAMVDFIRSFNFNSIKKLNVIFIPVANPVGFSLNRRRGYGGLDMNRHFSDKNLKGENKIIMDYLKKFKIYFFCSLHEDSDEDKFYLYGFEGVNGEIYKEIIKISKRFFGIKTGCVRFKDRCLVGHNSKDGVIIIKRGDKNDGSIESTLFEKGIPFLVCTETPMKQDMKERMSLNKKIMKKTIEFFLR
ncbi:MAG: DUF2817 domain-containing protein [Candidatus Pacearchaeota archaeon]